MHPTASATPSRPHPWGRDFHVNPLIVIWEVTRACQLHCLHCRAKAQRHRHPLELTKEEGLRLIDEIAEMDRPLFVLTGGDPLERDDLFDFIRYGTQRGLEVAMTPSATPRVTRDALKRAQQAGLARCAFSLDGSEPEIHDRFRGTRGSYDLTIRALGWLRELQMPTQVNTTVTRHNLHDLPRIADQIESFRPVLWSVFFLVPTGRARAQDMVSAAEAEEVMAWLWEQSKSRPFAIKTTAAPHYRRVILQKQAAEATEDGRGSESAGKHGTGGRDATPEPKRASGPAIRVPNIPAGPDTPRTPRTVNDGNGFVFISHTGDVYPSGFLPVTAGNIRKVRLADIYRTSPVFQALRNPALLKGKCGVCEFKLVCGGSRARAFAMTGDYLESDPACAYVPRVASTSGSRDSGHRDIPGPAFGTHGEDRAYAD
ncbi:radical SAM protein [Alicyclobacillus cellulosilyticus]|uniref:Radical SAM protein n=1 Tax=Alicyclobacillus cellulosilyticus TaxID=1003997 RepID=A0A917NMS4_9BACL|nr:TIGR04053 family radical SAM/SPASM domain-containing protein [Alicyclobacillus cellulosilyticus]GGJ12581.1 radical SAM protein [Alicyclobacillus cellulosilyticus]